MNACPRLAYCIQTVLHIVTHQFYCTCAEDIHSADNLLHDGLFTTIVSSPSIHMNLVLPFTTQRWTFP